MDRDELVAEARAWADENWDPHLSLIEWRNRLFDHGWAMPSLPPRYGGRGLPAWADDVARSVLAEVGAVGRPPGVGVGLAVPTLMTHGSDELKGRFVRRVLTGEDHWCQLFSEPGSGSDLAGLSATAQLDGQRWVVSGQKVWNTNAHQADYGLLLVRTDWSVPKHQGLTYFVLPMKQAGVQVRPLRQMNGHASFNEVFMDEAEIPRDWVVGEIGMGWTVAATTLAHERRFASMGVSHYEGEGQAVEEALEENARHFASYVWYPQRGGRPDLAVEHARRRGVSGDPVVRQAVAGLIALQRANSWTAQRALAARAAGRPPGAEGSIGKLGLTRVAREGARVHSLIAGASALTVGEPGSFESVIAEILVSVPGQSIAGGTDEIQKNIVGERMLGLAREPATDRDVPFKDVRRNL